MPGVGLDVDGDVLVVGLLALRRLEVVVATGTGARVGELLRARLRVGEDRASGRCVRGARWWSWAVLAFLFTGGGELVVEDVLLASRPVRSASRSPRPPSAADRRRRRPFPSESVSIVLDHIGDESDVRPSHSSPSAGSDSAGHVTEIGSLARRARRAPSRSRGPPPCGPRSRRRALRSTPRSAIDRSSPSTGAIPAPPPTKIRSEVRLSRSVKVPKGASTSSRSPTWTRSARNSENSPSG